MKLGLIAAATQRGLGYQTLEVYRHLNPHVTVVVDPGPDRKPAMPLRGDWYPGEPIIEWTPDERLPGAVELLAECDVVYSAETFYDWSLPTELARRGVATVLHTNPELYAGEWASAIWLPTPWLADRVGSSVRVVPMPCPVEYFPEVAAMDMPYRVVHPAGVGAAGDRNGTSMTAKAFVELRRRGIVTDLVGPTGKVLGLDVRPVDDWWERDVGAACSVLPRKYGGLCLPALEAFSAGVPVLMPDVSPQSQWWPIIPIPHRRYSDVRLKGGVIPRVECAPSAITDAVIRFLADPAFMERQRRTVRAWAEDHSWERLLPVWEDALRRSVVG